MKGTATEMVLKTGQIHFEISQISHRHRPGISEYDGGVRVPQLVFPISQTV